MDNKKTLQEAIDELQNVDSLLMQAFTEQDPVIREWLIIGAGKRVIATLELLNKIEL